MQPTERRNSVNFRDILILIITANADSLEKVWCGGGGGGGGENTGVKWARFMTTPGNYCNDY